jgi:hypothetical protein
MPAILEFPTAMPTARRRHAPDLAYETVSLWPRLRAALEAAHTPKPKSRWGVPLLHFFHKPAQRELERFRERQPKPAGIDPALEDLIEDAMMLLTESLDVRRTARATAGLMEAAAAVPAAKPLTDLLRMPEGEAIRVIHPAAGTGYRLLTFGVATVNQFHTLYADRIRRPGSRPSPDAVRAAGEVDPLAGEAFDRTRVRFLRPAALQTDGTLPDGFRASDHWYWGSESLAEFPLENGERLVLADEPAFAETRPVERMFPRLAGDVEVLEVMARGEVEAWLRRRCPLYAPARRVRERIAA